MGNTFTPSPPWIYVIHPKSSIQIGRETYFHTFSRTQKQSKAPNATGWEKCAAVSSSLKQSPFDYLGFRDLIYQAYDLLSQPKKSSDLYL